MTAISLIALSPLQGAEGELKKYIRANPQWLSPLPLIIPLHCFRDSFPRDRIDPGKLKTLPSLSLSGPLEKDGNIVLPLDSEIAPSTESYARKIHGKALPPAVDSPFSWSGLLLNPAGLEPLPEGNTEATAFRRFCYKRWQIGLYRIMYDEKRMWWEDIKLRCLWTIRKGCS